MKVTRRVILIEQNSIIIESYRRSFFSILKNNSWLQNNKFKNLLLNDRDLSMNAMNPRL